MSFLKNIFLRLTTERTFFYGWEQRAYERRQEQFHQSVQFACRLGRD